MENVPYQKSKLYQTTQPMHFERPLFPRKFNQKRRRKYSFFIYFQQWISKRGCFKNYIEVNLMIAIQSL